LADVVLIFVMGVYWLTSHEKATHFVSQITSVQYREMAANMIVEVEQTMGGYVRGLVLVMTIVGILNFVPMRIFGVPNATLFGFIIALTTAIPMIGGLIGLIMVVGLTLITAPQYVLTVLIIAFINQQIESYILSPRIMSNNVGMDPLLVIVYISIGFVLGGVIGGLIAIPVMGTLHILLRHLVIEPHKENITSFKEVEEGVLLIKTPPGATTTVSTETPAVPAPASPSSIEIARGG
jgi:predicted PurR-regulated permease PerM